MEIHANPNSNLSDEEAWKTTYLELQRVLHVMEHDSYKVSQSTPATWYQARAEHCMSLWYLLQQQHASYNSDTFSSQVQELEERVHLEYQRSNQVTAGLLSGGVSARESIRQLLFQGRVDQNTRRRKGGGSTAENDAQDYSADDDDDRAEGSDNEDLAVLPVTPARRSTPRSNINSNDSSPEAAMPSPRELQEQQREQMEEAIRQMASQMKHETERIHQTLKSQTKNLDALETVTSENVDAVSKVTENVQQHVQKSWTKTLGTWTVLLTLVGIFAFTLVTILMAPKRRDMPCIFFCPDDEVKSGSIPAAYDPQDYKSGQNFCRVMRDGTKECISDETRASWSQKGRQTDSAKANDNAKMLNRERAKSEDVSIESSCELDMYGECIRDQPNEKLVGGDTGSNGKDEARNELDALLNQLGSDIDSDDEEEDKPDPNQYLDESVRKMLEQAQKVQKAKEAAEARMEESMRNSKSNYGNVPLPDTISIDDLTEAQGKVHGEEEKPDSSTASSLADSKERVHEKATTSDERLSVDDLISKEEEISADNAEYPLENGRKDRFEEMEPVEPEIHQQEAKVQDEAKYHDKSANGSKDLFEEMEPVKPERHQQKATVQDKVSFDAKYADNGDAPSGDPSAPRKMDSIPVNDPFASRKPINLPQQVDGGNEGVPLHEGKPFSPREVRRAAAKGELKLITEYLNMRPDWANKADSNGWSAWHLAARSGHVHVIKLLLDLNPEGASQTTRDGRTARDIAYEKHGGRHPIVALLPR